MYCGNVFGGYVIPAAAPNEVIICLIHGALIDIMYL